MANNLNLHKRPITSLIRISGALWCQSERIPKARKVVVIETLQPRAWRCFTEPEYDICDWIPEHEFRRINQIPVGSTKAAYHTT
jgi:hypothetical protein